MSRGIVVTKFALIIVAMYFVVSSFVTNGAVMCFCSSSSFSGDEGFGGYMFNGFVGIVTEIDDGSSVCNWFLREYLFDQRGLGGGIGVSSFGLSDLFENNRGW